MNTLSIEPVTVSFSKIDTSGPQSSLISTHVLKIVRLSLRYPTKTKDGFEKVNILLRSCAGCLHTQISSALRIFSLDSNIDTLSRNRRQVSSFSYLTSHKSCTTLTEILNRVQILKTTRSIQTDVLFQDRSPIYSLRISMFLKMQVTNPPHKVYT